MIQINRTKRKQTAEQSFWEKSLIWLENPQKHYFDPMLTSAKYSVLVILNPNSRILQKTLLSGLLTFCPVNFDHVSLLDHKNSGRRYILKK
jgi:hypothetical protein